MRPQLLHCSVVLLHGKAPSGRTERSNEVHRAPFSVTVAVPARLHLGFLDLNGSLGRRFGSLGLAIDAFQTRLTVTRAKELQVVGHDRERAQRYAAQLQRLLGCASGHHIIVHEAVPSHAGLGSGTQLALAVASAMRKLHKLPLDVRGDAMQLGRGARSGVGIGLFEHGGFVIDGGRGADADAAPIVSRMDFPQAWRVLLVLDPAQAGVHGDAELAAFANLPPFSELNAGEICRRVLLQILPALAEGDFELFTDGVEHIQALLGSYFAPLQGGRAFTSAAVETTLAFMRREGGRGIGQSSWGPTGFVFARSRAEAERLMATARNEPACRGLDVRICSGLNHGAHIGTEMAANASAHF